jgi:hypothetical protein
VTGVGLVGMSVAPAGAVGALAGVVAGSVHLWPGLPTGNVCATETFTFTPITLAGGAISTNLTGPATDIAVGRIITDVITGRGDHQPLRLPERVAGDRGERQQWGLLGR